MDLEELHDLLPGWTPWVEDEEEDVMQMALPDTELECTGCGDWVNSPGDKLCGACLYFGPPGQTFRTYVPEPKPQPVLEEGRAP